MLVSFPPAADGSCRRSASKWRIISASPALGFPIGAREVRSENGGASATTNFSRMERPWNFLTQYEEEATVLRASRSIISVAVLLALGMQSALIPPHQPLTGHVFAAGLQDSLLTPALSASYLKNAQNIPGNALNNVDEIYYQLTTLKTLDPGLKTLSDSLKQRMVERVVSFQNQEGGFGDWVDDRSTIHETRQSLEILSTLGAQPANASGAVDFIYRLQITTLTNPLSNGGFKSYLADRDSDVSATSEAIRGLTILNAAIPNQKLVLSYLQNKQNPDGGFGLQTDAVRGIYWTSKATQTFDGVVALRLLQSMPQDEGGAITFLQSLQTEEGGFANVRSLGAEAFAGYTSAAVQALKILGSAPLDSAAAVKFLEGLQRDNGGFVSKLLGTQTRLESTYFAIQGLAALGADLGGHTGSIDYVLSARRYDGGFGAFPGDESTISLTLDAVLGLALLGKESLDPGAATTFLLASRTADGGFGVGGLSDVESTYRALYALRLLGHYAKDAGDTVHLLQSSQNADGGFGLRNGYASRGAYTFRAVSALYLLGAEPRDKTSAVGFLQSLQNPDGGFGNVPGPGDSDMGSTSRAVRTLGLLGTTPRNLTGAVGFIRESQLPDGGFAKSPHESNSTKVSFNAYTYDAIRALNTLNEAPYNATGVSLYVKSLRNRDFGFGEHALFSSTVNSTSAGLYTFLAMNRDLYNTAPTVSILRVDPDGGDVQTNFTITIGYSDANGHLPHTIFLQVNNQRFVPGPADASDYNVTDGKLFSYTTRLPPGSNVVRVEADDGLERTVGASYTIEVAPIDAPPLVLNAKVDPENGSLDLLYTYSVTYRDSDDDPPTYVRIVLDGTVFDMEKAAGDTYAQGVTFLYRTRLNAGEHRFRFAVSDGKNDLLTPELVGPIVAGRTSTAPGPEVFARIAQAVQTSYQKEITVDAVTLSFREGVAVWIVKLAEGEVVFSSDGRLMLSGPPLVTTEAPPSTSGAPVASFMPSAGGSLLLPALLGAGAVATWVIYRARKRR